MATYKALYGPATQAISITLAGLANASGSYGAGRSSAAIDNTTNLFLDAIVHVHVKTSASALTNDKAVYVYAYATADGGTTYTDGIPGTDSPFTATNPPNLRQIGIINCPATSTVYDGDFYVAPPGGILAAKWGIYVVNYTGQALDGAVGSAWYQGLGGQSV